MSIHRLSLLLAASALLVAAGCSPLTLTIGPAPDQRLKTKLVHRDPGSPTARVALIDVSGLIMNGQRPRLLGRGDNPLALLDERLAEARDDPAVRAVILRINSPGGAVTASDAMFGMVQRHRRLSGQPVVAMIMDVGASGGYYLACAADQIYAYPTSVTGSVGVIFQTITVKDGLNRIGVHPVAITSGRNKTAGSPLAGLDDEQRAVLQRLVDDFFERFKSVVREARPQLDAEAAAVVFDGRPVSGDQALALGLVDALGGLHDAFGAAKKLAGVPSAEIVAYTRPQDYVGSPYGRATEPPQVNLINLGPAMGELPTGFYYLWAPGLTP